MSERGAAWQRAIRGYNYFNDLAISGPFLLTQQYHASPQSFKSKTI
jgi:hypothetical protein